LILAVIRVMELPQLIEQNLSWGKILSEAHETLAFIMLGLIVLHLAVALKHRFLSKNPETDVLRRML